MKIDPKDISTAKLHGYMLSAIAPRPICFASTVDKDGNVNLSPYSFFNAFGSNPSTLIFSPARRVRDNTTKHTLQNVLEVPEVVINVVNYDMVWQMSLASTEYEKGVNEFTKSGFTEEPSEVIKPPRVKESPVQFECKVREVIETGQEGGAGNLIVCEIVMMHINDNVLDEDGTIDQHKIDLVARLGKGWYARASGDALFEIEKPLMNKGMGVDQLPDNIRLSTILTGNDLGQLGNVEAMPDEDTVEQFRKRDEMYSQINKQFAADQGTRRLQLHQYAQKLLEERKVNEAFCVLLSE